MSTKHFSGFPEKTEVTPIPTPFLTSVMPHLNDVDELKIELHIFRLLSHRRGYPRFITFTELLSDTTVIESIVADNRASTETLLRHALDLAVEHGVLLQVNLDNNGEPEGIYLINTDIERKTVEKIVRGEIVLSGFSGLAKPNLPQPKKIPDIFTLYEQNIGILTPIIAEELQEAEKRYPADWIESAFKEAVSLNKRNWKYIARILERWLIEGKDDGSFGRNIKKERDPDKYVKGKYGHMVQR